jgi:hypothetical protein
MNDFEQRQINLMLGSIEAFQAENMSLNELIMKMMALNDVLNSSVLEKLVLPLLWELEEINAILLEEKRPASASERALIAKAINTLKICIRKS